MVRRKNRAVYSPSAYLCQKRVIQLCTIIIEWIIRSRWFGNETGNIPMSYHIIVSHNNMNRSGPYPGTSDLLQNIIRVHVVSHKQQLVVNIVYETRARKPTGIRSRDGNNDFFFLFFFFGFPLRSNERSKRSRLVRTGSQRYALRWQPWRQRRRSVYIQLVISFWSAIPLRAAANDDGDDD